jgi:tRNA(fMet)-specific endonuclease VapC
MKKNKSYLLDTDIIIYWLKNKFPSIDEKINRVGESHIFISTISVAELYFGVHNSDRIEENKLLIDELIERLSIIAFDEKAAEYFGEIKAILKSQGKIICDSDLFIAATAAANDLVLVTNNERHFKRIENLYVENWV